MRTIIKLGLWGCLVGFLIWFYDYDFLLNMGGPRTPISDAIRNFFGINQFSFDWNFYVYGPLVVLMMAGLITGLICGLVILVVGDKTKG